MESLRIEQTDDSPRVILDREENQFEISGKSLPEDAVEFYKPVLDWLNAYRKQPLPLTEFNLKLAYFNTSSSKLILDILLIFEEIILEGHDVVVRWHSLRSDEDMQEAGKEFDEMIEVPFDHMVYDK